MSTNQRTHATYVDSLPDKNGTDHLGLSRTLTVQPLPPAAKAEGGLLLDAEGLDHSSSLRLAPDGHTVLLPQPTDDPNDPLHWSWTRKHLVLFTVAWAALSADWTSAAGPSVILQQAAQWGISPEVANRPNSINILFGGIGGLVWVPLAAFWGRAPVLFWTTVAGFGFSVGAAVAPTYEVHFAMRVLTAFFLTSGQTMTIAVLKDIFYFHERARKIGLWAVLYIASPYLGPCLGNFIVYRTGRWQDVFWLCAGVVALQIILVLVCIDETFYNRAKHHDEQPDRPAGVGGRLVRILGIWQLKHHKTYFPTAGEAIKRFAMLITKPAFFLICFSYLLVFAWAIGINISTSILFALPTSMGGYGYSNKGLGFLYFTPIVAIFLGEIFGHFFNDWIARRYIYKHHGVFEPEVRLWMIYISIAIMIPALILVGEGLRWHLNVASIIFGWGMYSFGIMTMSVAVTAYALDTYPTAASELGGWLTFARTFGGFSIGYFQSPWLDKVGADGSFGTQAAIVAVAAVPIIILHSYGHKLRTRFGEI